MKRILIVLACSLMLSLLGTAAPLASCGGVSDVSAAGFTGAGNGCLAGGLLFLFFPNSVTSSAGFNSGAIIGIGSQTVTSSTVSLDFQISNVTGSGATSAFKTGDIVLLYEVVGPILGIDQNFTASVSSTLGANLTLQETACTAPFATPSSSCSGTILGQLTGIGNSADGGTFVGNCNVSGGCDSGVNGGKFTASSVTYIKKDIQFNQASMTDFNNSADVPEPMTLTLLGAGLLGLGLLRKKKSA